MDELTDQNLANLRALVQTNTAPVQLANRAPFVLVPEGYTVREFEDQTPNPIAKIAARSFTDINSFCAYVNEQKLSESRIYVTSKTKFQAVLDHDEPTPGKAGWERHTATLDLTQTEELKTWSAKNSQKFDQRNLARFIEDNMADIVLPPGADLLDLVRTFKATQNAEFNGVIGEKKGNSTVAYTIKTTTSAGKGDLDIPEMFRLEIAPYEGAAPIGIDLRLCFQIDNGKLSFWFEILRLERILKKALTDIAAVIQKATGITPWYGLP